MNATQEQKPPSPSVSTNTNNLMTPDPTQGTHKHPNSSGWFDDKIPVKSFSSYVQIRDSSKEQSDMVEGTFFQSGMSKIKEYRRTGNRISKSRQNASRSMAKRKATNPNIIKSQQHSPLIEQTAFSPNTFKEFQLITPVAQPPEQSDILSVKQIKPIDSSFKFTQPRIHLPRE